MYLGGEYHCLHILDTRIDNKINVCINKLFDPIYRMNVN